MHSTVSLGIADLDEISYRLWARLPCTSEGAAGLRFVGSSAVRWKGSWGKPIRQVILSSP